MSKIITFLGHMILRNIQFNSYFVSQYNIFEEATQGESNERKYRRDSDTNCPPIQMVTGIYDYESVSSAEQVKGI